MQVTQSRTAAKPAAAIATYIPMAASDVDTPLMPPPPPPPPPVEDWLPAAGVVVANGVGPSRRAWARACGTSADNGDADRKSASGSCDDANGEEGLCILRRMKLTSRLPMMVGTPPVSAPE
jgi:hypothetical protein